MPLFQRYIGIDYSGAMSPTSSLKGLRVYVATPLEGPLEVQPPPSAKTYWTRRGIAHWLSRELSGETKTLVGIDHGFSFPLAYFQKYKLPHDWPALLDDFQQHWPCDEDYVCVDFVRYGSHGNGAARTGNSTWRRLAEVRTEAKSVFHFDVPGSVAKSTHAGLPWLRYLRRQLGDKVHFWPFDGWDAPLYRSVIAEVYPRMWKGLFPAPGLTMDQQDAYSVAAWMRREDQADRLDRHFAPTLSGEDRALAQIEGWILGLGGEDPKRNQRRERKDERKRERSRSEEAHCAECHIRRDSKGLAWIDDTGVTVAEVAHQWTQVDEDVTALYDALPTLSRGQVHAALAYYFDQVDLIAEEIAGRRS